MNQHPSALALDLIALGNEASPEIVAHLRGCTQCEAHVAASRPLSGPVPSWATQARPGLRWPWVGGGLLAAAILALTVISSRTRELPNPVFTRAKGQPSVAVYVEHRGEVRLWDGRSPVAAGDRLQLKVAGAGFKHLAVGVEEGDGWSTAFTGPVSATGETTLPQSFRVEADTTRLRLGLLLCDEECPADGLTSAARDTPRDAHRWWTAFDLSRKDAP